eukprot:11706968-Alexandrium_andersonii.AAC.1
MAARAEEVKSTRPRNVWGVRPVSDCRARTGRGPIGGRWVDRNKGDSDTPNVRSRYVAQDIALY